MYLSIPNSVCKAYLQWYPFSRLSSGDKSELRDSGFYDRYIRTGAFVFFPEVMRRSDNYVQKHDGTFRNSKLVSPVMFLVLQAIGKEVSSRYTPRRPTDVDVYYSGNYELMRPRYTHEYDDFYKAINEGKERYQYFIKTDIASFFGSVNVNALVERLDRICNHDGQSISQVELLLIKELLLHCGDGYYPMIENSMASSYLATVVYLDEADCRLHEFMKSKVDGISSFRMIRYVDDLYVLFSTDGHQEKLASIYNMVRNEYSSILRTLGLALNSNKCAMGRMAEISEELKKSRYDECVNGVEFDMGELFYGRLEGFLREMYADISGNQLTGDRYHKLIERHFSSEDIEFTPEEVLNYLVYEDQSELKRAEVSDLLERMINEDVAFLSIDPKRLTVLVLHSRNGEIARAMLNQLFNRRRAGLWNSYDTTVAIAYLIQRGFRHPDLLKAIEERCPDLYAYYTHGCRGSFVTQLREAQWNGYVRCIENDAKAAFLYFMSICERGRSNYLGAFAYYKNYFDRISADIAFIAGNDSERRKPNYKKYYREGELKKLYRGVAGSEDVIKTAHKLRNESPLAHSSASLIDGNGSSDELLSLQRELERLVRQYIEMNLKNL